MLLPNLIPLIDVTFSTPTPDFNKRNSNSWSGVFAILGQQPKECDSPDERSLSQVVATERV
jgi:hypothetical protein